MTLYELDLEIDRLHKAGRRQDVVALMRKYGIFTNERVVTEYLRGRAEQVPA